MKVFSCAAAIGMAALTFSVQAQVHGHLNIGANSKTQGAPLIWANGADFMASSNYVNTLYFTNAGRFAGYYNGNITLTGLAATSDYGGPDPQAASPGSLIQFKMACLEGPAGGSFGFWDAGTTSPSISLSPGQSSTNLWRVSENDGSPGSDPYGHIHGRRFTATKAGIYKVAFTAVDVSTNGTAKGPIHTPSVPLQVYFEAGVNIQSLVKTQSQTQVKFAAPANYTWQLMGTDTLQANPVWAPVGAPVVGDDYFHSVTDPTAPAGKRFYRMIGTPIQP